MRRGNGPLGPGVAAVGLALVILALPLSAVYAQASPIEVDVDRRQLSTDETLTLTVTITGESTVPTPATPRFDEFSVLSRSSSSQISKVNGVTSAQVVYRYRLQPIRTGRVTIEPIEITLAGKTYASDPITVQVTQGSGVPSRAPASQPSSQPSARLVGQDYFVEASVDNANPYLGQQVTYIFRLYRASGILGRPRYDAPEFTGFWNKQDAEQRTYSTQTAGRNYRVTELRAVLFPTLVGPITIEPATLTVPGSFFERSTLLRSEPVSLRIAPLPEDAPQDYGGAVGQFSIRAEIDSTSGRVSDPLTLTVTISGQGNLDTLADPSWPEMAQWRAFDSSATINTHVANDRLAGSRVYTRVLVPGAAGSFSVPSISFTYFDTSAGDYRTIATAAIPVTIEPGASQAPIAQLPGLTKDEVERLTTDIRHIKDVPAVLDPGAGPITDRAVYWLAWVVPAAVLGAAFIWRARRLRLYGSAAAARSGQAERRARRHLARARADGLAPYAAAAQVLTGYISDKLDRPVSGLTRSAMAQLLASRNITPGLIERVEASLAASEGGRFAPQGDTGSSGEMLLEETGAVIAGLEREFPS